MRSLAPGAVIAGRYRLEHPLGEGAIGAVWSARQTLVERTVAIKFLKGPVTGAQRERFLREAQALGRLNHPNCITVHDFGYSQEHDTAFLVMEHLEGQPLSDWRGTDTPLADVVGVMKQVATGLAYAHHQGVCHRDLKPENVFLARSFEGGHVVKVLDFGLALVTGASRRITAQGEVFGTPVYMSPEQIRSAANAGPQADIYAFGVMLFELLDGRVPYLEDDVLGTLMRHLNEPAPQLKREVPSSLAHIVDKCLEKDPENRYPTGAELYAALSKVEVDQTEETLRLVVSQDADTLPRDALEPRTDEEISVDVSTAPMRKPPEAAPSLEPPTLPLTHATSEDPFMDAPTTPLGKDSKSERVASDSSTTVKIIVALVLLALIAAIYLVSRLGEAAPAVGHQFH